jgi:hypothetical protein
VAFVPFACTYFVNLFFRNVNAVISRNLTAEFSLAPSDLGLLTSMHPLAFAVRYGMPHAYASVRGERIARAKASGTSAFVETITSRWLTQRYREQHPEMVTRIRAR